MLPTPPSAPRFLTVGVPTYNRAPKLQRLLKALCEQVVAFGLETKVRVLVSDNGSTDDTEAVVRAASASTRAVVDYYKHEVNQGFDPNVMALYRLAGTEYLWYFGDDDLPTRDALPRIVAALEAHNPDALFFSFVQPPGSSIKTFDFPAPVQVLENRRDVVDAILKRPK